MLNTLVPLFVTLSVLVKLTELQVSIRVIVKGYHLYVSLKLMLESNSLFARARKKGEHVNGFNITNKCRQTRTLTLLFLL